MGEALRLLQRAINAPGSDIRMVRLCDAHQHNLDKGTPCADCHIFKPQDLMDE